MPIIVVSASLLIYCFFCTQGEKLPRWCLLWLAMTIGRQNRDKAEETSLCLPFACLYVFMPLFPPFLFHPPPTPHPCHQDTNFLLDEYKLENNTLLSLGSKVENRRSRVLFVQNWALTFAEKQWQNKHSKSLFFGN